MLNLVNSGTKNSSHRLLIAVCISLLLHALVLFRFGVLSSAGMASRSSPLQVSLVAMPGLLSTASEPQPDKIADVLPLAKEIEALKQPEKPRKVPAIQRKPADTIEAAPTAAVPGSTPVKEPLQAGQSSGGAGLSLSGPVNRAEIAFEIRSGVDGAVTATGRHVYASDNGRSYGVSIKPELKADDQVQGEGWQLQISGSIQRDGLSPSIFQVQGGALPERLMSLKEVPGSLTGLPGKARRGRLPDGLLDRQSLLYQFMHKPPALTGGKLWLSDGGAHALYTYRVAGFESLTIASHGVVHTIKLLFSTSDSSETIELWLIPDSHYLPAKMRHTDMRGVVTEQVTVSLDFR